MSGGVSVLCWHAQYLLSHSVSEGLFDHDTDFIAQLTSNFTHNLLINEMKTLLILGQRVKVKIGTLYLKT